MMTNTLPLTTGDYRTREADANQVAREIITRTRPDATLANMTAAEYDRVMVALRARGLDS